MIAEIVHEGDKHYTDKYRCRWKIKVTSAVLDQNIKQNNCAMCK